MSQSYKENYDETFVPMIKHETIRILLLLLLFLIAANKGLHHLDVKSDLKEEIFLEHLEEFESCGHESKVLRLRKSIYGLKQSAQTWNKKATESLAQMGFQTRKADQCLYTRKEKDGTITYVLLYVDDLLVTGSSAEATKKVGKSISTSWTLETLAIILVSI